MVREHGVQVGQDISDIPQPQPMYRGGVADSILEDHPNGDILTFQRIDGKPTANPQRLVLKSGGQFYLIDDSGTTVHGLDGSGGYSRSATAQGYHTIARVLSVGGESIYIGATRGEMYFVGDDGTTLHDMGFHHATYKGDGIFEVRFGPRRGTRELDLKSKAWLN